MKKVLFTIAIVVASLSSIETKAQVKDPANPTEVQTVVGFSVRAKHPNAKKQIASLVESIFGMSFQGAMKALNSGTLFLKTGVTKEEAASIKSALEAAGAEVEVK
jgi:large subunit ribosomal protein L7/L12